MRLIPGKTKVKMELFKGIRLADAIVAGVGIALVGFLSSANIPGHYIFAGIVVFVVAILLARMDGDPNYILVLHMIRHYGLYRHFKLKNKYIVKSEQAEVQPEEENTEEKKEEPTESTTEATVSAENTSATEETEQTEENTESSEENSSVEESETENEDSDIAEEKEAEQTTEEVAQEGTEEATEKTAEEKAEEEKPAEEKTEEKTEEKPEEKPAEEKKDNKKSSKSSKSSKDKVLEMEDITSFTGIKNNFIEFGGRYLGAVMEIPPVDFRFFSQNRRIMSIEQGLGRSLRSISTEFAFNLVKIEKPAIYDNYIDNEYAKIEELKKSFENGFIKEDELKARMDVVFNRIEDLKKICYENKVIEPHYYIVLYDSDAKQLELTVNIVMENLKNGELHPKRLKDPEIAVFLRFQNDIDFDEREIDKVAPEDYMKWILPEKVEIKQKTIEVNDIITHNYVVNKYPSLVGDAWMAGLMSIPATKVVIKAKPMERGKAIKNIDHSLQELRDRFNATGVDSKRMELQGHIETLASLLATLQGDNEMLFETNIYVTAYDIVRTKAMIKQADPNKKCLRVKINNMVKVIKRMFAEEDFRLNRLEFNQLDAYIGQQISAFDPLASDGRSVPSNTLAAAYPWIYAHVSDKNGIKLGFEDGIPNFVDFFRRDSERVNSNVVIVGKSGSGKSYSAKSLLTNLAADDSKIFILDPENEYMELAANLHGKFINVGNAQHGRLNPFHIITTLDDDQEGGSSNESSSFATHLQFLEEFFRQILPDCEKDALEYLNSMVERMYNNMGITEETDLTTLAPEDYPTFNNLYDTILEELQSTDNTFVRSLLRVLMNYISKFAEGGRNSAIWNGPSTITTEENFTVFNFQSLLANRNGTIANAQMLLVLKYVDNEIIKNREYNRRFNMHRKVIVVIDEAHVFIDTKFPVALDFMFQLAKRIRKYNGMQVVITQNIKDFVGSEELARKSTAIINACQYSFIFSLSPNDMEDLCKLYEKAGGVNEKEQEQIISAQRGQAFAVLSPQSRSTIKIESPKAVVKMFKQLGYESELFSGEEGEKAWEDLIGACREKRKLNIARSLERKINEENRFKRIVRDHFEFNEMDADEFDAQNSAEEAAKEASKEKILPAEKSEEIVPEEDDEFAGIFEEEESTADDKFEADEESSEDGEFLFSDEDEEIDEFDEKEIDIFAEEEKRQQAEKEAKYKVDNTSAAISITAPTYTRRDPLTDFENSEKQKMNQYAQPNVQYQPYQQTQNDNAPQVIIKEVQRDDSSMNKLMDKLSELVESMGRISRESILGEVRTMIAASMGGSALNNITADTFQYQTAKTEKKPVAMYELPDDLDEDYVDSGIDEEEEDFLDLTQLEIDDIEKDVERMEAGEDIETEEEAEVEEAEELLEIEEIEEVEEVEEEVEDIDEDFEDDYDETEEDEEEDDDDEIFDALGLGDMDDFADFADDDDDSDEDEDDLDFDLYMTDEEMNEERLKMVNQPKETIIFDDDDEEDDDEDMDDEAFKKLISNLDKPAEEEEEPDEDIEGPGEDDENNGVDPDYPSDVDFDIMAFLDETIKDEETVVDKLESSNEDYIIVNLEELAKYANKHKERF